MSYDIEICSDDGYTAHADFQHVYAFIASLPDIIENGPIGFTYEAGDHYYMEIDLELVDADGNWTDNESPDSINCIRMHIPYRHMQRAYVDPARYFEICTAIAHYLHWRAIDLQTGRDLLEGQNPASTDQIVSTVLTTMQRFLFGEEEDK